MGNRKTKGISKHQEHLPTLSSTSSEIPPKNHAEPVISPSIAQTFEIASAGIEIPMENLNLKDKKEINILLLGETGAGKSTFINAIFNYLQFEDFKKAEKENLNVLIPANFSITDKEGDRQTVEIGSADDSNENLKTGASATQGVKTYSFHIKGGQTLIRLIDTPGMVDTRGIEADEQNCENILTYLNRLHHLHAICYVVKSQQSRLTVQFIYCVSQILSRLEKSACKNIVFVFTHSKGSNYSPGETIRILKEIAEDIKKNPAHAEIPLDSNAFCFDSEAFMALAAIKQGIALSPEVRKSGIISWNKSTNECWKMITYILGLKPHMVHNTTAINEARRIIYQLAQPMADIAQLANDNIQILQNHKFHLDLDNRSLADLKKKLYIPVIDLVVKPMSNPTTVCADLTCSETYNVGEKKEAHYKRCHERCYLTNVPRDQIGSPELMNCSSMGPNQKCTKCSHSYKVHMHIYYMTEKKQTEIKDNLVSININTKELVIEKAKKVIANVEQRQRQLESELNTIVKCNAKFAHFLTNNAIAPFNDSYAEYINYQMTREKRLGSDADLTKLAGLQRLLREHNEMKKIFKEAAEMQKILGKSDEVTPQDISKTMRDLFKLTINGSKIKELFDSQNKSRSKEYTFSEYTHTGVFQQTLPNQNKKQDDKAQFDKKGEPSASNPTTKFQRGRNNNRGNANTRSKSNGRVPADRTPPPPYYEATNQPRHPSGPSNYPPDYRAYPYSPYPEAGRPYYPPHPEGGRPYYPPHPEGGRPYYPSHPEGGRPYYPPHPEGGRPYYPSHSEGGRPYYPPTASNTQDSGLNKPHQPTTLLVNVTVPIQAEGQNNASKPPRHPPPRDYHHPDQGYVPRDYYGNPRDPYYPPRDPYYPPRDPYHPRDVHPPRDGYPYDPRYGGQGPSSPHYPPPGPSARPYNYNNSGPGGNPQNPNRNQSNHPRGNYRGNKSRGGINRKYRKKQDNNEKTSGDDSDTSVASSAKM